MWAPDNGGATCVDLALVADVAPRPQRDSRPKPAAHNSCGAKACAPRFPPHTCTKAPWNETHPPQWLEAYASATSRGMRCSRAQASGADRKPRPDRLRACATRRRSDMCHPKDEADTRPWGAKADLARKADEDRRHESLREKNERRIAMLPQPPARAPSLIRMCPTQAASEASGSTLEALPATRRTCLEDRRGRSTRRLTRLRRRLETTLRTKLA